MAATSGLRPWSILLVAAAFIVAPGCETECPFASACDGNILINCYRSGGPYSKTAEYSEAACPETNPVCVPLTNTTAQCVRAANRRCDDEADTCEDDLVLTCRSGYWVTYWNCPLSDEPICLETEFGAECVSP